MNTKRTASAFVAVSILTLGGLGISIRNASIQPMLIAQAASCDSRIRENVFFSARVLNYKVNLRADRSLTAPVQRLAGPNVTLYFDAWGYGDRVNDIWINQPDERWYKIRGENLWVSSAVVAGNAPNSKPLTDCSNNSQQFSMPEYYLRLYGHVEGSSSRGFATHKAIDSTDRKSPYEVRALVGGKVTYVKNGQIVGNPYNYRTGKCQNNSAAYNGTVEIWNPDLKRTFTYLHFARNSIRVRQGEQVNPGDVIGIEGSTGCSTAQHTHLAVNVGAENPLVTLGNARRIGILDKKYK